MRISPFACRLVYRSRFIRFPHETFCRRLLLACIFLITFLFYKYTAWSCIRSFNNNPQNESVVLFIRQKNKTLLFLSLSLQFRCIYLRDNDNKLILTLIEIVSAARACLSDAPAHSAKGKLFTIEHDKIRTMLYESFFLSWPYSPSPQQLFRQHIVSFGKPPDFKRE